MPAKRLGLSAVTKSVVFVPLPFFPVSLRHIVSDPRAQVAGNLRDKNGDLGRRNAKVAFISNYSGGFLIANCAGKKCTAPCLQGVSTEFVLIEKVRVCKV